MASQTGPVDPRHPVGCTERPPKRLQELPHPCRLACNPRQGFNPTCCLGDGRRWALREIGFYRSVMAVEGTTERPRLTVLRPLDATRHRRGESAMAAGVGAATRLQNVAIGPLLTPSVEGFQAHLYPRIGMPPVVLCPARGIERMRLPASWCTLFAESRLLVLVPFASHHRRPTAVLAEQRNRFAATLADEIFVGHAGAGSRTEHLCIDIMAQGKRVYTFDLPEDAHLIRCGAIGQSVSDLVAGLRHHHL